MHLMSPFKAANTIVHHGVCSPPADVDGDGYNGAWPLVHTTVQLIDMIEEGALLQLEYRHEAFHRENTHRTHYCINWGDFEATVSFSIRICKTFGAMRSVNVDRKKIIHFPASLPLF